MINPLTCREWFGDERSRRTYKPLRADGECGRPAKYLVDLADFDLGSMAVCPRCARFYTDKFVTPFTGRDLQMAALGAQQAGPA